MSAKDILTWSALQYIHKQNIDSFIVLKTFWQCLMSCIRFLRKRILETINAYFNTLLFFISNVGNSLQASYIILPNFERCINLIYIICNHFSLS